MGKVWVLDTETKGTGAEMVPLEKVEKKPAQKPRRRRPAAPKQTRETAAPPKPERFRIVDVMTGRPLLDGAGARETVERLREVRSPVDVTIHAWDDRGERWQRLSRGEEQALWRLSAR